MTNKQIAQSFAEGQTKGKANSMFIETWQNSTVIYSYGYHFPMAIRTSDSFAFVNSSKYSRTTSCHQGLVKRALQLEGIETEDKTTTELKAIISNGGQL